MKNLFALFVLAFFVSSCSSLKSVPRASADAKNQPDVLVQKVDKDELRDIIRQEKMIAPDVSDNEMIFKSTGEGVAPLNTVSASQALILAKRAALADAHSQLAAKLYGVKINGRDSVKDAMLGSSTITSQVNGLIKNAEIVDESFNQGLYRVSLELKIDAQKWKELFAY